MYKVELSRIAQKKYGKIIRSQPKLASRITKVIDILRQNPHVGVFLKGEFRSLLKYKVGSYRVLYSIKKSKLLIHIIDIDHRKDIYR